MNELQVVISQDPGSIKFNFEELKTDLQNKLAVYQGAVFTNESKTIAKGELASLRKLRDSVEKRRKEVKNQCMVPYNDFEKKVKELLLVIDKPIQLIDMQLKDMEEERIRKQKEDVKKIWEELITEAASFLPLEEIYDKKWNLAGTSQKKIREEIEQIVSKAMTDLSILQKSQSDVAGEAIDLYKKNRDLTGALTYINNYEANKAKALRAEKERRARQEEQRLQQEIERAKAEERQKLAEIERAREEERTRLQSEAAKQEVHAPVEPMAVTSVKTPFVTEDEVDELPFTQPDTVTAFYKVVATEEELEQVEMAFNSIGVYFARREV
ncbi:MAG: DUF1351 domain-containing protein [Lachnospiraceae bacterium]|nr:DUF1351 domain-containing protein [Lachnospiraceae bacterium]